MLLHLKLLLNSSNVLECSENFMFNRIHSDISGTHYLNTHTHVTDKAVQFTVACFYL